MTDLERLRKALEFFKANEWTQGQDRLSRPDGSFAYCAEGALRLGAFSDLACCDGCIPFGKEVNQALRKLHSVVREITDDSYGHLSTYNDADGRTKEDMIAVFEAAIQKERVSA